jgi:sulfate transport system substrate-binding protein
MVNSQQKNNPVSWLRPAGWILGIALLLACLYYAIRVPLTGVNKSAELRVYAFSTLGEVLSQAIFPAFEQAWEAENGVDLVIEGVYGPSGTLAGQINLGAPADVAIFSNARHVEWLKIGKRLDNQDGAALICATPLVILTREGNPLGIRDYSNLGQPGLRLVHADPRSSGVGEWAILGVYGNAYLPGKDTQAGTAQLKALWQNVRLMGTSARASLALFELGAGDALLTYEQDALMALERNVPLEIVLPERTILARHYAVVVADNLAWRERPVAEAFVEFLGSDEGQQLFSQYHFRPASLESQGFPALQSPFTEADLGGWNQAYEFLVTNFWLKEIEPGLKLEPASSYLGTGE